MLSGSIGTIASDDRGVILFDPTKAPCEETIRTAFFKDFPHRRLLDTFYLLLEDQQLRLQDLPSG
jgi:hypothetical protein